MKFSCCIEMIYTEYEFAERIQHAKKSDFDYIEFWCWKDKDINLLKSELAKNEIGVGIFQGNINGRMTDPNDHDLYIDGVLESVETAKFLGAKNLFLMSDIMQEDRSVSPPPYEISDREKIESTIKILKDLRKVSDDNGITFVIEPLNTLVDHRGYSLKNSRQAFDIVKEVDHQGIKVLYDAYHMQIMEGNIISTFKENLENIGYFHIADVPGRHEPGTGELNYGNIIGELEAFGYQGIVGFEFAPRDGRSSEIVNKVFEIIG